MLHRSRLLILAVVGLLAGLLVPTPATPLSPAAAQTATTVLFEDFEDASVGYVLPIDEFSDGAGDYFTRTDGSNIGTFVSVSGFNGASWFGAQDLDGEGALPSQFMNFPDLDIAGLSNLELSVLLAEDDDGTSQDWDTDTSVRFTYSIDGGPVQTALAVESVGGTNTEPAIDTDFDGIGDGAAITSTFAEFVVPLVGVGSSLTLQIEFEVLDAGDEDIAIDDVTIRSAPAAGPTTALFEDFEDASVGYVASVAEFSDGAGDYFTRTDGSNIGSFVSVVGFNGASWFGAQDLDGEGAAPQQSLTFANVDIAGLSNLEFSVLLAEDDDGTSQDWDTPDFVSFTYSIDGGPVQNLLAVENDGSTFNSAPFIDPDFDGVGDGAEITSVFTEFTAPIVGTGSLMDLVVTIALDSGDEDIAIDDVTITGGGTPIDNPPTLAASTPAEGGTLRPSGDVELTFSEPVTLDTSGGPAIFLNCDVGSGIDITVSGGPTVFTVSPDNDLTVGASCTLSLEAARILDQDGTPDPLVGDDAFDFSVVAACPATPTLISAIQGSGSASPLVGQVHTVQGIVTADFQDGAAGTSGDLNGFFVQEETGDEDGDPATSEGIFVFDGSNPAVDVNPGDTVQATGTVIEFSDLTELSPVTSVEICSTSTSLADITRRDVSLPFASVDAPERYENMAVRFPQDLVISEYFNFDRFGEIVLSQPLPGEDRIHQPTAVHVPGSQEADDRADYNSRSRIVLDDGRTASNPDPALHPNGQTFDLTNRFRGGDQVTNATGVLNYSFDEYRIQPTTGAQYTSVNPRPAAPPDVGGSLQVASFNVLNYFITLDDGVNDICGPNQALECRGADTAAELDRQEDKIVDALVGLDADVVGLVELENNPAADPAGDGSDPVLEQLVVAINAVAGPRTYDFVDAGTIGTDAIKVGFIYKPDTVTPVGSPAILDMSVDPMFLDSKNRPVLIQTFEEVASGERFTAAINHLKSKGSACDDVGDPFDLDGQGNCNGVRTDAAIALANYLATDPTGSGDPDVLILGDLNSYDEEDPIQALLNAGFTDLEELYGDEFSYGYVFDGQFGYLDYALSNPSLTAQVTGAESWHINGDEPDIFDYNTDFKQPAQIALYEANEFRSSDHDPVVVGLDLGPTSSTPRLYLSSTTAGNAGGVAFADEDIVSYDTATGTWAMVFDGSDVNVGGSDVDGFHIVSLDPFVVDLSFGATRNLPGIGQVDDSDVVTFTGTAGPDTSGSFALKFDGSDVGLTSDGEDIDAIAVDGTDSVFSTSGNVSVPGLNGNDEDLISFTPTSTGSTTAGAFALFWDGSDVGLSPRDLTGASVDSINGAIYGAALNTWTVAGVTGDSDDVFAFSGTTGPNPSGTASIIFDGDVAGYANEQIDGLQVVAAAPPEPGQADLAVAIDDDTDIAIPGGQVTFTITVDNQGPDSAVDVIADTTLPSGLSLVSTTGCLQDPAGDPCSLGAIASGGSAQFTLVADVAVGATGDVPTSTVVSSAVADPDPSDNSASVDTFVATPPGAVDDGPGAGSQPGDPFHTAQDTILVATSGSPQDLLGNDAVGDPAAGIASFGGGSLGGTVTSNGAGDTVAYGNGGSLTVLADGGFTFVPETGFVGSFVFEYRITNPAGSSDAMVTILVGDTDPPSSLVIYLSSTSGGSVQGISFSDEDILAYDTGSDTWSMVFDGSDVNVGGSDVDAFRVVSVEPLEIEMSFGAPRNLPGLGMVDDSDVVVFTGTGGPNTSGGFSLAFDGSDVGLTSDAEDVDALAASTDGLLLVSTVGNAAVAGLSGADEDLLSFDGTTVGSNTVGSFGLWFDGSDLGLGPRDLTGAAVDDAGVVYGAATGSWTVDGVTGDSDDVFAFNGTTGPDTAGVATIVFDGDLVGFANEQIDGLDVMTGAGQPG